MAIRTKTGALALLAVATLCAWPLMASAQPGGGGFPPGGPPPGAGAPPGGPPPGGPGGPGGLPGGLPGGPGAGGPGFPGVGGPAAPANGRAQAPFDPSGYWVSLVTQDWRFRMVVPGPGQFSGIPITLAAKQASDSFDAATDTAAGKQCEAYGAPALMMLPTRLHVSWQDDNTLSVETDAGMQTRVLHFKDAPPGDASWQGYSRAKWLLPAPAFGPPRPGSAGKPASGVLRVTTTNLLAGLLRKNGVPYSDRTVLQEDWMENSLAGAGDYLTITTLITDPVYLRAPYYVAPIFMREPDASKWHPASCTLTSAR